MSIMKRNKRKKMADGGMVNEELNPNHEPGLSDQTSIQRDSIDDSQSVESRPWSDSSMEEDRSEGMLGMDAKSIVAALRAKHDNYPRPDDRYDQYGPQHFADGGTVAQPSPSPAEPYSQQAGQDTQKAMRKAFHFAEGGEVADLDNFLSADAEPMPEDLSHASNMIQAEDEDPQKKRLSAIMSALHAKHYAR